MERGRLLGGRYRLEGELGHGGMSVVWRAHDDVMGRKVAVKLLTPKLAGDTTLLDRIRAEARVAACMCHPHVVNVYDYGEASFGEGQPVPFVVMEIVEGTSLSEALANGPLEWRAAVRACAEVASALAVAHARGIVHRDVTPRNVMLTPAGAKLVDFGISATVGEAEVGPGGFLLGTPAYLAPERLDGGSVQPATDVYALGLLLYKALTGRLPWQGTTTAQMLAAHRYVEPAPLPPVPGLPPQVAELCRRCLAKRPGDRPTSAEVAAVLAPACLGPEAVRPPSWTGRAVVRAAARTAVALPAVTVASTPRLPWYARWLPHRRRSAAALAIAVGLLLAVAVPVAVAELRRDSVPRRSQAAGTGGLGPPGLPCKVRYVVRSDSGRAFSAGVTVTNTGQHAIDGWRLEFSLPGHQRVLRGSPGDWHQSGHSVVVDATSAGTLAPGDAAEFGFDAAYWGQNPSPTAFHLNGAECAAELSR